MIKQLDHFSIKSETYISQPHTISHDMMKNFFIKNCKANITFAFF